MLIHNLYNCTVKMEFYLSNKRRIYFALIYFAYEHQNKGERNTLTPASTGLDHSLARETRDIVVHLAHLAAETRSVSPFFWYQMINCFYPVGDSSFLMRTHHKQLCFQ